MTKVVINEKENSPLTLISFTGLEGGTGGIVNKEFFNLTKDYTTIFVEEKRSWYNRVNSQKIIDTIPFSTEVITIGNSMGAFNATIFSNFYPVSKVIAFATQYSIHPKLVPWDKRYRVWANKITDWKIKHLIFNNFTQYYFISGDADIEISHLNMIPDLDNINKIIIEGSGHKLSKDLKARGELYPLIERILAS
jgi:hypothetical protein